MVASDKNSNRNVFIRFQVPENKVKSFMLMFQKAVHTDFIASLKGVSEDMGTYSIILGLNLPKDTVNLRDFVGTLNMVFVKLFDFYPTFSEKPSTIHISGAKTFIEKYDAPMEANAGTKLPVKTPIKLSANIHAFA